MKVTLTCRGVRRPILTVARCVFVLMLIAANVVAASDSYVFCDGDVTYMLGQGMSAGALKQIQTVFGNKFLWARRNGQTFVSYDDTVLDLARAAVQRKGSRSAQERRLAAITDGAIRRGVARRLQ
jgi:hypothetical protein